MASDNDGNIIETDSEGPDMFLRSTIVQQAGADGREYDDLLLSLQIENTDAVIINDPNDIQLANQFRGLLTGETIALPKLQGEINPKDKLIEPKVKLVNEFPVPKQDPTNLRNISLAFERTNYIFIFATKSLFENNSILSRLDTILTNLMQDEVKKQTIIPVNTKSRKCRDYNLGVYSAVKPIEFWSEDNLFLKSVHKLFEMKIGERLERDKHLKEERTNHFGCMRHQNKSSLSSSSSLPEWMTDLQLHGRSTSADPNQVSSKTGVHPPQRKQAVTKSNSSIQIDGPTSGGYHSQHFSQGQSESFPRSQHMGMVLGSGVTEIPRHAVHQNNPHSSFPMYAMSDLPVYHDSSVHPTQAVQAPAPMYPGNRQQLPHFEVLSEQAGRGVSGAAGFQMYIPTHVMPPFYSQPSVNPYSQSTQLPCHWIPKFETSPHPQTYSDYQYQYSASPNRSTNQNQKADHQNPSHAAPSQPAVVNNYINIEIKHVDQAAIGTDAKVISTTRQPSEEARDYVSDDESRSSESSESQETTEPSEGNERGSENPSPYRRSAGGSVAAADGEVLRSLPRQPESANYSSECNQLSGSMIAHPPSTEVTQVRFRTQETEGQYGNSLNISQQTQVKAVDASDNDDLSHQTQVKHLV